MSGTAQGVKASYIRIPNDFGRNVLGTDLRTQNDFGAKKITVSTSSAVEALNQEYSGQFVFLRFFGAAGTDYVEIALTKRSSGAEIDTAVASSNNASTPASTLKVGARFMSGEAYVQVQLPEWDRNEIAYLVHEGSSAGTIFFHRAS